MSVQAAMPSIDTGHVRGANGATGIVPATVSSIMRRQQVTITSDVTADHLADRLIDEGLSGVVVVDRRSRPLGMATKTDLIWYQRRQAWGEIDTGEPEELPEGTASSSLPPVLVSDVMTHIVLDVTEDTPIEIAAAIMAYEGIGQLAVTDQTGAVVGLVRSVDVMRWLGRRSGYGIPHDTQEERTGRQIGRMPWSS